MLFFALFVGFLSETNVTLDYNGFIDRHDFATVQFDGTLLIPATTHVLHFSAMGQLLNSFGKKGNEPGAFQAVLNAIWDGEFYYCMDAIRADISVFDRNGNFLRRFYKLMHSMYHESDQLFYVRLQPFLKMERGFGPVQPVTNSPEGGLLKSGEPFHFVKENVFEFKINFKNYFVTSYDNKFYVFSELDQEVGIYDTSRKLLDRVTFKLNGFVPHGKYWGSELPVRDILRSINQFSRIKHVSSYDHGIIISFYVPNPNDLDDQLVMTRILDGKGRDTGIKIPPDQNVIGGHGRLVYSIVETEDLYYRLVLQELTPIKP